MLGTRNSKRLGILRDKANMLIPTEVKTDQSMLSCKKSYLKSPMNSRKDNKENNSKNVLKENEANPRKVITKNSASLNSQDNNILKQAVFFENIEKLVAIKLEKAEVKTDQSVLSRKKCNSKSTMNLRRVNKGNNNKNVLSNNQVGQRKVIPKISTSPNSHSTDALTQTALLEQVEKPVRNILGKAEIKTVPSVSICKKSNLKCTMNLHCVNEKDEKNVFVQNKVGNRKVVSQNSTSLKSQSAATLKQTVLCKREERCTTNNLLKAVKQNIPLKRPKRATKASQESLKENINSNMIKPNTDSKITNFFQSQTLEKSKNEQSNQSRLHTNCSKNTNLNHIPVYKKAVIPSKLDIKGRKRSRVSDIYDINRDEEMIMETCALKKKSKTAVKKPKPSKPKVPSKKMSACRFDRRNKAQLVKEKKLVTKTIAAKPDKTRVNVVEDACIAEITVAAQDVQKESEPSLEDDFNAIINEINNFDPVSAIEDLTGKSNNAHAPLLDGDNTKFVCSVNTNLNVVPSLHSEDRGKLIDVSALTPVKYMNNRDIMKKGFKDVQSFVDEFEASFQMPHLTSTPDNGNQIPSINKQATCKNNFAVRMLEISSIPPITPIVEQCYLTDTELSPEKIDLNALEITLFESPVKADEKKKVTKKKVNGKKIQTELHFENCEKTAMPQENEREPSLLKESNANFLSPVDIDVDQETTELSELIQSISPDQERKRITRRKRACVISKENKAESDVTDESDFDTDDIFLFESPEIDAFPKRKRKANRIDKDACTSPIKYLKVLKPRKSYHSPAEVKRCFSRTKKVERPAQMEFQTKDEKLIQSMNEHFSELDSLELCIE